MKQFLTQNRFCLHRLLHQRCKKSLQFVLATGGLLAACLAIAQGNNEHSPEPGIQKPRYSLHLLAAPKKRQQAMASGLAATQVKLRNAASQSVPQAPKQPSNEDILRFADKARGGGLPGLKWEVNVNSQLKKDKTETFELLVSAASGNWVAEFKKPRNVLGNKLLKIGDNMWFTKRNLRKPVPISQRQRLTGSAANGDIASTNYAQDYQANRLADENHQATRLYVFDLKSKDHSVTYERVKYWINTESGLGVKAEFYTAAGRLLKSATFEYDNRIVIENSEQPFISRMVIQDEVNKTQKSTLEYSAIEIKAIPSAYFRL